MGAERGDEAQAAILWHLWASAEPLRESFLYQRVRSDGVDISGDDFIAVLLRLQVEGHVRMDPVHDEVHDPAPFEPRFWRIIG